MSDLKPCPFCGGKAKFVFQPKYFEPYRNAGIWCQNRECLIYVWHRFDNSISDERAKEMLAELWNRRANNEAD